MLKNTLTRRLSGAALVGGLLVTAAGTGAATAAPAAGTLPATPVATAKSSTAAENAKASAAVVNAISGGSTPAELAKVLRDAGGNPELTAVLTRALGTLPQDENISLPESGPDGVEILPSQLALQAMRAQTTGTTETCDTNTKLAAWARTLLVLAPEDTQEGKDQRIGVTGALLMGMLDAPTYQALYQGPTNKKLTVFGEEQNKTAVIKKAFKDGREFWDVDPGTITLSAMKDDIATDASKKARAEFALYSYPGSIMGKVVPFDPRTDTDTPGYVSFIKTFSKDVDLIYGLTPQFEDGENAIFTANAFASSPEPGETNPLPKRLIFGDGMLTFLRVAKFGDTGIKTVMGHEYGHHLQYTIGFDTPEGTVPEKTRHSELEADAFANYFGAHVLGDKYTKSQRQLSIDLGYAIGDCGVADEGHHGTPAQRKAAAVFGQELADLQKKNKHVFAAESVRLKFNKELPGILAAK